MHPFSPLLRKFGFGGQFEHADCLVYLPAYHVACWGLSTSDANSLAHEFVMLLDKAADADVRGGTSLPDYWRSFNGFVVQETADGHVMNTCQSKIVCRECRTTSYPLKVLRHFLFVGLDALWWPHNSGNSQ